MEYENFLFSVFACRNKLIHVKLLYNFFVKFLAVHTLWCLKLFF
jgi:hypothetical protein